VAAATAGVSSHREERHLDPQRAADAWHRFEKAGCMADTTTGAQQSYLSMILHALAI
jgi:hypothetical protein